MSEIVSLDMERLKRNPVTYTVTITHTHEAMFVSLDGIPWTENNMLAVEQDLLDAIEILAGIPVELDDDIDPAG